MDETIEKLRKEAEKIRVQMPWWNKPKHWRGHPPIMPVRGKPGWACDLDDAAEYLALCSPQNILALLDLITPTDLNK